MGFEELLAAVEAFLSNAGSAIARLQSLSAQMPKVEGEAGNIVSQIQSSVDAIAGHHGVLHAAVKGGAAPAAAAAPEAAPEKDALKDSP